MIIKNIYKYLLFFYSTTIHTSNNAHSKEALNDQTHNELLISISQKILISLPNDLFELDANQSKLFLLLLCN